MSQILLEPLEANRPWKSVIRQSVRDQEFWNDVACFPAMKVPALTSNFSSSRSARLLVSVQMVVHTTANGASSLTVQLTASSALRALRWVSRLLPGLASSESRKDDGQRMPSRSLSELPFALNSNRGSDLAGQMYTSSSPVSCSSSDEATQLPPAISLVAQVAFHGDQAPIAKSAAQGVMHASPRKEREAENQLQSWPSRQFPTNTWM
eukprot:95811-Amphidinium_carterae.1